MAMSHAHSRVALQCVTVVWCAAHVKYWLGAGRGGFGLSSSECWNPTFYCQVYTTPLGDVESERSMTVKTSEVPIKPPYFSAVKSTNYLPNVLTVMDAQAAGFDQVSYARAALLHCIFFSMGARVASVQAFKAFMLRQLLCTAVIATMQNKAFLHIRCVLLLGNVVWIHQ